LLIIVSFVHLNLLNKCSACLLPSIPFSGFCLPVSVAASSPSLVRHTTLGGLQGQGPAATSLSIFLGAVRAPTKRVRFHGDKKEPSQRAAPVRLPRRLMEEAGSSSAQGRMPNTRARAKLADSSDTRHREAGFFPQHEGRSGPRALR
jgi:hypothetical protein